MKILEILKKILSSDATGNSEENMSLCSAGEPYAETKTANDYVAPDDIRLVVGDDMLAIIYDIQIGGLHNALSYDPCSGIFKDCLSEINNIVCENLEEVYQSIIVKTNEHEYLLNIGTNLMLGASSLSQEIYEILIDAFYPIIKRFIDDHITGNKVGIYSIFANENGGTSVGLQGLVRNIEKDGYVCVGVGTAFKYNKVPFSLEIAKEWENFTYIDMNELPENILKSPISQAQTMILSLLHNKVIAKMKI